MISIIITRIIITNYRVPRVDSYDRGSKWVPLYHYPGTNQIVQHDLKIYDCNWTRLTGDVRTGPEDDSLITLVSLGLTDTMRLNTQTKRYCN